jgi:hypothetical protein
MRNCLQTRSSFLASLSKMEMDAYLVGDLTGQSLNLESENIIWQSASPTIGCMSICFAISDLSASRPQLICLASLDGYVFGSASLGIIRNWAIQFCAVVCPLFRTLILRYFCSKSSKAMNLCAGTNVSGSRVGSYSI